MDRASMLIEVDELLARQDDPNLRIYDATIQFFRSESEPTAYDDYVQGHIPGAAFFDHEKVSDPNNKYMYMVLPEAELAAQIGRMGIHAESEVIVYANGLLPCATRAWWVLRYAGHNNVRVLNGGLAAWRQAGGAVEQGPRQYEAATFACQLRPDMFVGKEQVQAAMEDAAVRTVHTLPQESYADAHIVGSACLPCSELMHDMAAFLPTETLVDRLRAEAQHERIITYCGGGIAATVNAMAHLMAGNSNVAVYDGSMSEWVGEGLPTAQDQGA